MTAECWAAYLIVEQGDSADWLLHEAHPTLVAAFDAAEAYMTTDRSHGGRPYTWVHVIEQAGADVLHDWVFDEYTATWVSADRDTRTTTAEVAAERTRLVFEDGAARVRAFAMHHEAGLSPESETLIGEAFRRGDR